MYKKSTLHWSAYPQREQDKNLAMAWIDYKKACDMAPQSWKINGLKMYKISDEDKLYRENHENLESGIDSRREKLSWNKDPKRYIPLRCSVTIIYYDYDDATQPHTHKCTTGYKLTKSQEKIIQLMYMNDISLPKMKKNWKL